MLSPLINTGNERAELQAALRWDYSQLGDAAETVIEHTIEIKRHERRANDAVVEAGRHLIAVKETLAHGQWGDWLDTEFNMSDRTARTLMSIAERFDGKTEVISDLSVTILGLLAAPSTPDAAVDAVIEANRQQPVRVADAKAIIADHKPTVDPWQAAATASGSRQKRIEYMAAAIKPWIETYIDDYGRSWRAIDERGNVAHTNSLLWTDITHEAQRRNAVAVSEDILKEAIKLAFSWLRAAAAPSTISNQQSPINNAPDLAPRPSPLAPSPYKSLAQMDADGEIPPLGPPSPSSASATYAPIPAGWNDDDEAEYQALLPTWQKPAGDGSAVLELDRITRRRVAERLSVERLDNLQFSLQERCRILWLEERRAASPQSPIPNPSPYKSLAQMDADGEIPPLGPPSPSSASATYAPVHPLQSTLRALLASATAADLRTTANYRGGSRWFEARRLLQAAGLHYRDRDLVQALNNLADELEQRERTQPAQPSTPSTDNAALFDYEIDDVLAELVTQANATLDGQIHSVFPGSATYWAEQVSQVLQKPVTYQRMTLALERAMRALQEQRAAQPGFVPSTPSTDAKQPGFVPIKIADDRIPRCRRLIGIYNQAIAVEDEYGALTGCYSETTAPKRELQKLIDRLQRTIDLLEGKAVAVTEECD